MIVVMQNGASERDIDYIVRRARSLGLQSHVSEQQGQILVGLSGDMRGIEPAALRGLPGVEQVKSMSHPYRLASREFRTERTVIPVQDLRIGGEDLVLMGGPCSVESKEQILECAHMVKEAGGQVLRGGAFKPRSSPYSFQGLAEDGLKYLAAAREETGLAIITEVMAIEQVEMVCEYTDILQIGTRNMHNFNLLHAVGRTRTPVMLKRGMMSTLKELLLSAEYILSQGNPYVMLCERGIRTFETYTRNTLDINAVPSLRELTHLPVIVDPSHATGKASLVRAASRAAVAAGCDGLIIEMHPDPSAAWSDGAQSLAPDEFRRTFEESKAVSEALKPLTAAGV